MVCVVESVKIRKGGGLNNGENGGTRPIAKRKKNLIAATVTRTQDDTSEDKRTVLEEAIGIFHRLTMDVYRAAVSLTLV